MCRNGVAVEMSFDHKPEDEVHLCKLKTIAKENQYREHYNSCLPSKYNPLDDQVELKRIKKAGGKVTPDGRVNGGLNLSRAIGWFSTCFY